jgi:hypothetical protein
MKTEKNIKRIIECSPKSTQKCVKCGKLIESMWFILIQL